MSELMKRWQSLKEREQKLVMVMGAVLVVFLFFSLILNPMNSALEANQKKLEQQKQLQSWMHQSIAKIKASGNPAAGSGNLSQIVNRSTGQFSLKIARMQPRDSELNVVIDLVEFNKFISWLNYLQNEKGVIVKTADFNRTDTAGFVRVSRLVLSL